jgi:hypothetical protein
VAIGGVCHVFRSNILIFGILGLTAFGGVLFLAVYWLERRAFLRRASQVERRHFLESGLSWAQYRENTRS